MAEIEIGKEMYRVTYKPVCEFQETSIEEDIKIREDYLAEFINILKASGYLLVRVSLINYE